MPDDSIGKQNKNKGIGRSSVLRFEESLALSDKNLMELPGERSRFPASYVLAIQRGHRHDLHRGVAQEAFLCLAKRLDLKLSFIDGNSILPGQAQNDASRDAIQNAASQSRCAEPARLYKKQIADGTFGDVRFPIQQHAIKCSCGDRFTFRLNIVQKIGGFDLRVERTREITSRLGHDQTDTRSISL
jgi:hypothetical protein